MRSNEDARHERTRLSPPASAGVELPPKNSIAMERFIWYL